jgi:hypothetical protein
MGTHDKQSKALISKTLQTKQLLPRNLVRPPVAPGLSGFLILIVAGLDNSTASPGFLAAGWWMGDL